MKKELSQAGISLVQVMISLAIMAIAQLAMMKMSETQNKSAKTTEVKFDSIEIINNIRSVLGDKEACRQTFGPILPASIPTSGVHNPNNVPAGVITEILNADGTPVFTAGTTSMIGSTRVKILSFALDSSVAPAANINAGDTGRTHFEVTLDRTDDVFGAKEITKKILLNVRTIDDGSGDPVIVECSTAATGNSLPTIADYVCKSIGGTFLPSGRDGGGDCYDLAPNGRAVLSKPFITPVLPPPTNNTGAELYGPVQIDGTFAVNGQTTINGVTNIFGGTTIDGDLVIEDTHTVELKSDRRLKWDVHTLKGVLAKVKKLRGVSYKWRSNDQDDIGVIAQEIKKQFPSLVSIASDGYLVVKYPQLTAVLLQALKEVDKENQSKSTQIKELNKRQDDLEKRLLELEKKAEK